MKRSAFNVGMRMLTSEEFLFTHDPLLLTTKDLATKFSVNSYPKATCGAVIHLRHRVTCTPKYLEQAVPSSIRGDKLSMAMRFMTRLYQSHVCHALRSIVAPAPTNLSSAQIASMMSRDVV
jgi:hypothetical protein